MRIYKLNNLYHKPVYLSFFNILKKIDSKISKTHYPSKSAAPQYLMSLREQLLRSRKKIKEKVSISIETISGDAVSFSFFEHNTCLFFSVSGAGASPISLKEIEKLKKFIQLSACGYSFNNELKLDLSLSFKYINEDILCLTFSKNTLFKFSANKAKYLYKFLERLF